MSQNFSAKKQKILSGLSRPSDEYTDASPKGSVDEGVRELIRLINDAPSFVTTSSCAGRVAVYLEGPSKPAASKSSSDGPEGTTVDLKRNDINLKFGGKGGGVWLLTSHSPVDLNTVATPGQLLSLFGFKSESEISYPAPDASPQFVHFKFEPMILHILAASAEDAQVALQAGLQAGFRESGISGLSNNRKGQSPSPMVAIRSSGLALDSIIGYKDPDSFTDTVQPTVSEPYLRMILKVANERFVTNEQRMARLFEAFRSRKPEAAMLGSSISNSTDPVSRIVSRDEKRAKGLAKKAANLSNGVAMEGIQRDDEPDYSLTLLDGDSEQQGNDNTVSRS